MKLAGLSIVVLFVALLVGAAGARWIGQQRQGAAFPLPGADGCWDGLCFSSMPPEDVLAALRASPRVVPESVAIVERVQPSGYDSLIAFTLAAPFHRTTPVLLYWATHSYHLTRDWRLQSNPALLWVGDVLAGLGPPDRVGWLGNQISLYYANRRLEVLVAPSEIDLVRVRILPGDAVIGLFVVPADSPRAADTIYYPPSAPWQGFGEVRFSNPP